MSFVTTDEFSVRVTKLFQRLVSHEITAYLFVFNLFSVDINYGRIIIRM